MKTTRLWVLLGITVLAVSACSTTPSKTEEQTKKAAETNTALGQQYMNRGQYEIALEKLKRAVAYDKTYAPAYTMLGVLYETIGKTDDAAEAYALAVKYDPEGGDVNNNYGAFLCRTGESGKADDYFLTAIDDPFYQTPEIALSNAGACALSSGDLDKAESFLRQSLKYNDKLAASLLPMAEVSYRKGEYLRARAFLQRYEAVAPVNADSLAMGVKIETELGDQKAAERYRQLLREL